MKKIRFTILQQVILTILIIAIFPIFEGLSILSIFTKIENLSNSQVASRVISISITNPFTDRRKKECIEECKAYVDEISTVFSLLGVLNFDQLSIDYNDIFQNRYPKPIKSRIRILSNDNEVIYDTVINESTDNQFYWMEDEHMKSSILTVAEYKKVFSKYLDDERYYCGHDYYDGPFYSDSEYNGKEIQLANSKGLGIIERFSLEYECLSTLYLARPLYYGSEKIGVILVSKPFYRINSDKKEWGFLLGKFTIISLMLSLPFIVFLVLRLSIPIRKLSEKIIYFSDLNNFEKNAIPFINRNDEVGDLSKSFSILMEKLKRNIDYIESFSSDITHELKNPISSIEMQCELLLSDIFDSKEYIDGIMKIMYDTKKMNSLLVEMRENSRFYNETVINIKKEIININELIANIKIAVKNLYPNCNFTIHSEKDINNIMANSLHVERLFYNLIENAASFSSIVAISIKSTDKTTIVIIEDSGPGIPDNEKNKIFNRFYSNRNDNKKEHSGLGLFNVKMIVDANNWEISVDKSEIYGGAKFTLQIT